MNEIAQNTVLISGGAGSMGQLVSDYINSRDDFTLTAIHDPNYEGQEYKIYKDLKKIEEDVVLEFSPASVINENIDSLLNSDADLIIGSSGVSSEMISKLKTITNRKVIVIPNFSIGAAYQKLFSLALSENFNSVNISEKHHGKKQDAPSGTAIELKNFIELNNHQKYVTTIEIESKRILDVFGIHEVTFFNNNDRISFKHEALSRKIFADGAISIAKSMAGISQGMYTTQDFFK